jgi:hypothetical protein
VSTSARRFPESARSNMRRGYALAASCDERIAELRARLARGFD